MLKTFFQGKRYSVVWLVLRLWLGYQWLEAGLGKLGNPAWTGDKAGAAVTGFLKGAVAAATGDHPSVKGWYAGFAQNVALPNAKVFSYLVAYGEVLVGVALILGFVTTFAAVMGAVMNLNFMFAGSASTNPYMYTVAILVILAGANAGYLGVDRYLLPWLRERLGSTKASEAKA